MIITVDQTNLFQAAALHSVCWKESHRAFCAPDFIEMHTPERQLEYITRKINDGSKFYMLAEEKPIGIVSVNGSLIEDLYVRPDMQNMGYGTKLLRFASEKCSNCPTLWILENNVNAERLYRRMGFRETGNRKIVKGGLDEVEFAMKKSDC